MLSSYANQPTITRPLGVRVNAMVHRMQIDLEPLFVESSIESPPNHLEHHSAAQIIYTDGSKNDSGVDCAIAVDSASYS
nr:unnamed protein product [Callosobruchus analis]